MNEINLQHLGLSKEESKVYVKLCLNPMLTIASLSKHTGLHRPHLYRVIPGLVEKNIVKERTVGKRTLYRAVEPRMLYSLLKKQQNLVAETIDQLQNFYEEQSQKPDIEFYVGKSGYKAMFDDIADVVPKGGQILRYSARKPDDEDFNTSPSYRERRNKEHFERLAITSAVKGKRTKEKRFNKFTKIIPKTYDAFDDHVSQMIYEDRVVFIDHENETTFIIKSAKIAGVQKKLYKLLWKFLEEPK